MDRMQTFRILLWFGAAAAALAQTADFNDAKALFEEGQQRLKVGQAGMAKVTFETLIAVYPESSLVSRAREEIKVAEEQEPKPPMVRALRFENFKKVKVEKILQRLKEREVGLGVETPFDPREVEDARKVLEQLVTEEGVEGRSVLVSVRELSARGVAVTFRLVKD